MVSEIVAGPRGTLIFWRATFFDSSALVKLYLHRRRHIACRSKRQCPRQFSPGFSAYRGRTHVGVRDQSAKRSPSAGRMRTLSCANLEVRSLAEVFSISGNRNLLWPNCWPAKARPQFPKVTGQLRRRVSSPDRGAESTANEFSDPIPAPPPRRTPDAAENGGTAHLWK